jgi:hypothetical protein
MPTGSTLALTLPGGLSFGCQCWNGTEPEAAAEVLASGAVAAAVACSSWVRSCARAGVAFSRVVIRWRST